MGVTTLGSAANATERVAETIQRRGATGSGALSLWTSVAGAGAALAVVAMFVDWYAAVGTATAWYSGFLPPTALVLIVGAGALLVARRSSCSVQNHESMPNCSSLPSSASARC